MKNFHFRYTMNIVRIARRIISRLQQISAREIEIVALVGIILWNDGIFNFLIFKLNLFYFSCKF